MNPLPLHFLLHMATETKGLDWRDIMDYYDRQPIPPWTDRYGVPHPLSQEAQNMATFQPRETWRLTVHPPTKFEVARDRLRKKHEDVKQ